MRALVIIVLALGCSGNSRTEEPDFGHDETTLEASDATGGTDAQKEPAVVHEDFRVVYGYRGRPVKPEFNGKNDLFLADARDADPTNDISLTEKALKKVDPTLNCDLGCFVDPYLRWMVVVTETSPTDGTHTLKLGRFGANLSLNMMKFEGLTQVKHLVFAGNYLFFSRPQPDCVATEGPPATCYQIWRLDLNNLADLKQLATFPTPDSLAHSLFAGYFTASDDGTTLLFMNPTNISQRVYLWRDGHMSRVGDPLCTAKDPSGIPGKCGSTGTLSTYTEKDPVAISPDGKTVVFALVEGDELRLYRHDLETDTRRFSVLLSVPSPYQANKCYNREPWQYTAVLPPLRFSRDGKDVIFLGYAACGENQQKPWTNIVRIALDRIGTGQKLTASDLKLVTDNPTGDIARCISISYFDLSPSGQYITFIGTPTIESDGKTPIKDTDNRHRSDAEVYVTASDGSSLPVQITNSLYWSATTVQVVMP